MENFHSSWRDSPKKELKGAASGEKSGLLRSQKREFFNLWRSSIKFWWGFPAKMGLFFVGIKNFQININSWKLKVISWEFTSSFTRVFILFLSVSLKSYEFTDPGRSFCTQTQQIVSTIALKTSYLLRNCEPRTKLTRQFTDVLLGSIIQ